MGKVLRREGSKRRESDLGCNCSDPFTRRARPICTTTYRVNGLNGPRRENVSLYIPHDGKPPKLRLQVVFLGAFSTANDLVVIEKFSGRQILYLFTHSSSVGSQNLASVLPGSEVTSVSLVCSFPRTRQCFYGEADVDDEDDLASKAPNSIRDPNPAFWVQAKLFRPRYKVVPGLINIYRFLGSVNF